MPSRSATGTFKKNGQVITVPTWAVSQEELPMRISVDSRSGHHRTSLGTVRNFEPVSDDKENWKLAFGHSRLKR